MMVKEMNKVEISTITSLFKKQNRESKNSAINKRASALGEIFFNQAMKWLPDFIGIVYREE